MEHGGGAPNASCLYCGPVVREEHVCPVSKRPRYFNLTASTLADDKQRPTAGSNVADVSGKKQVQDAAEYISSVLKDNSSMAQQLRDARDLQTNTTQENQRLTSELKQAATSVATVSSQLTLKKKELELLKRRLSKQPVAAVAAAPAQPKASCEVAIIELIDKLVSHYKARGAKFEAAYKPPAPPPPPPPPPTAPKPGPPVAMIMQKNQDPRYLTERELKYEATGQGDDLFYFDSGTQPWNPNWSPMASAISSQIKALGSLSGGAFTPTVGATPVSYSHGQHQYTVEVRMQPYPVPPAPPPPPPAAPPSVVVNWEAQTLFEGPFMQLKSTDVQAMLSSHDFDASNTRAVGKQKSVVELGDLLSSFASKCTFDVKKSELWIKPKALRNFLDTVQGRGYLEVRPMMHGMHAGPYDLLFDDPMSGDPMASSAGNAQSFGFYVSPTDFIPRHYGKSAKMKSGRRYPNNTVMIGILASKPGLCDNPKLRVDNGAFCMYRLASTLGVSTNYPTHDNHQTGEVAFMDAICIRDYACWLPIGLLYG